MNRGRIEIMHDMLVALDGSGKKTHLMFRSNISYAMVERYLAILLAAQCVRKDGENYCITEGGQKLRDAVESILEIIDVDPEKEETELRITTKRTARMAPSLDSSEPR